MGELEAGAETAHEASAGGRGVTPLPPELVEHVTLHLDEADAGDGPERLRALEELYEALERELENEARASGH